MTVVAMVNVSNPSASVVLAGLVKIVINKYVLWMIQHVPAMVTVLVLHVHVRKDGEVNYVN
jgi:hypothetical protein